METTTPSSNNQNANANRPRYRVPDELRETLLDFTIAYLLERPPNLVEFGVNFFQRLSSDRLPAGGAGPAGTSQQTAQDQGADAQKDAENANVEALNVEPPEASATPSSGENFGF